MEFEKLLSVAAENQKSQKPVIRRTSISSTPIRHNEKKAKGVESAAVKAFLEKMAREEKEKEAKEREKKAALLKARVEAKNRAKTDQSSNQKDAPPSTTPSAQLNGNDALAPTKMTDFVVGQRNRVSTFVRPAGISPPKRNPCLIRAEDEPPVNHCLVRATDSGDTGGKPGDKTDKHKKHKKHRHHDSGKSDDKHRLQTSSKTPHENERSKLKDSSGGKAQPKDIVVKSESKVVGSKKKGPLSNKLLASLENARRKRAQALDFQAVLALASERKNVEPTPPPVKVAAKKAEEPPMTQKEKERLARTKTPEYQAWLKRGGSVTQGKVENYVTGGVKKSLNKVTVSDQRKTVDCEQGTASLSSRKRDADGFVKQHGRVVNADVTKRNDDTRPQNSNHMRSKTAADVCTKPDIRTDHRPRTNSEGHVKSVARSNSAGHVVSKQDGHARMNKTSDGRASQGDHTRLKTSVKMSTNGKGVVTNENCKTRPNSANVSKTKTDARVTNGHVRPPADQKQQVRLNAKPNYTAAHETVISCRGGTQGQPKKATAEAPMSTWDRLYSQIKKNEPKPVKRKQPSVESSEEEDSELDDFIADDDDEEIGGEDYSSAIRDIFGYDRRKYKYETDDDLHGMETTFTQQLKEERRSAIIGRKEDLEEERREAEMLQRKMAKKKMKSKH